MKKALILLLCLGLCLASAVGAQAWGWDDYPDDYSEPPGTYEGMPWYERYKEAYEERAALERASHSEAVASNGWGGGKAVIGNCKEWVNVRAEADAKSESMGKLYKGEKVEIIRMNQDKSWAFVEMPGKDYGVWVSAQFLM